MKKVVIKTTGKTIDYQDIDPGDKHYIARSGDETKLLIRYRPHSPYGILDFHYAFYPIEYISNPPFSLFNRSRLCPKLLVRNMIEEGWEVTEYSVEEFKSLFNK